MQEKKLKGSNESASSNSSNGMVRTTIVIPPALAANLEVMRIREGGISKNDLIMRALTDFILSAGLQPDRHPRIQISY